MDDQTIGELENGVDAVTDRLSSMAETRSYELNKDKSLKKKLQFTNREHASINVTGGGLKIEFSTGMYELFKQSAKQFYSSDKLKYKCQTTAVHDEKGREVETKYRLTSGRNGIYTLNLYHTKCSCLVNGKQVSQFIENHMHEIIALITSTVNIENTSVDEVNAAFNVFLTECVSASAKNQHKSEVPAVEEGAEVLQDKDTISISFEDEVILDRKVTPGDNGTKGIQNKLEDISSQISDLKTILTNHIENTAMQVQQLRDEIHSVKTQNTVNTHSTVQQIEIVTDTAIKIDRTLRSSMDNLQRRLQSIGDSFRSKQNEKTKSNEDIATVPKEISTDSAQNRRVNNGTLIIGDSILKGIHPEGLHAEVEVQCLRGAKTRQIKDKLLNVNLHGFKDVVIYVGGNDVASGMTTSRLYNELREITSTVKDHGCDVLLSTICPRDDVNVAEANETIKKVCVDSNIRCVNIFPSFVFGDSSVDRSKFTHDGIHLSDNGTRTLLRKINDTLRVYTPKRQQTTKSRPTGGNVNRSNARRSNINRSDVFQTRGYSSNNGRNNRRRQGSHDFGGWHQPSGRQTGQSHMNGRLH